MNIRWNRSENMYSFLIFARKAPYKRAGEDVSSLFGGSYSLIILYIINEQKNFAFEHKDGK